MICPAVFFCLDLNPSHASDPNSRVSDEFVRYALDLRENSSKDARVFDRLGRALREEGNHRVRCVAKQRYAANREGSYRGTTIERPCPPVRSRGQQIAGRFRPSRERAIEGRPIRFPVPRMVVIGAVPSRLDYSNEI